MASFGRLKKKKKEIIAREKRNGRAGAVHLARRWGQQKCATERICQLVQKPNTHHSSRMVGWKKKAK